MTTGDRTFKGLAVPLNGESEIKQITAGTDLLTLTGADSMASDFLVLRDADKSEILFVQFDGRTRLNIATAISAFGVDVRFASTLTDGWCTSMNVQNVYAQTSAGAPMVFAIRAHLDVSSGDITGGREAVLSLYYKTSSSLAVNDTGFIFLDDGGSDAQVFLNIGQSIGTCGGIVRPSVEAAATHGLRCMIHTTPYYIMLTSCTKS